MRTASIVLCVVLCGCGAIFLIVALCGFAKAVESNNSMVTGVLAMIALYQLAGGAACISLGLTCFIVADRLIPLGAAIPTMTPAESRQVAQTMRPRRSYNEKHIGIPAELSGKPAAPSRESDAAADALLDAIKKRDRS